MDFSTDKGSSWTELASFTVTRGDLQHYTMDVPLEGSARFRIVQTSGSRVNIDDITIYAPVQQEPIYGDVNGDGEVNIADVNTAIDAILINIVDPRCDVNNDGEVNIADINVILSIILGA